MYRGGHEKKKRITGVEDRRMGGNIVVQREQQ